MTFQKIEQQLRQAYTDKNTTVVLALCPTIRQYAQQATEEDHQHMRAMFELLIDHDNFSRLELWDHDAEISSTALALHNALPPTHTQATDANHLGQYFHPSHARSQLLCAVLLGPKTNWNGGDIDDLYYVFSERLDYHHVQYKHHTPIAAVHALMVGLHTLQEDKASNARAAKDTVYRIVTALLYDDCLKLYEDVIPMLNGYTLVKRAVAHNNKRPWILENLDKSTSAEQLEKWFPRNSLRVRALAQSYPRLQALVEKRSLLEHVGEHHKTARRNKL